VIKHTDTKSCAPDLVVASTYVEPTGWDEVWGIASRGFTGSLGQSCWQRCARPQPVNTQVPDQSPRRWSRYGMRAAAVDPPSRTESSACSAGSSRWNLSG